MSYQETIASYAQVPGIIEAFHAVEKSWAICRRRP